MGYLFLSSIFSSLVAILFKLGERRRADRIVVSTLNYIVGFSILLIEILIEKDTRIQGFHISYALENLLKTIKTGGALNYEGSILWGVIVGFFAGISYFTAFVFYQKSIKENGVGITGTVRSLNILIPMFLSMILWMEIPNSIQWIGIALSIASIVLLSYSKKKGERVKPSLLIFYILGGTSMFMNKLYQKFGDVSLRNVYLLVVFLVASLIGITFLTKRRIEKFEIALGFFVGISNLLQNSFLILSLSLLKSTIAFPIFGVVSILLINMAGKFIFSEEFGIKKILATGMALASIILINL